MRNMYAVFAVCVANILNTSEIIYFEPIFIECRCNKIVLVASFSPCFALSLCRVRAACIYYVHSPRLAPLISTTVFLFICQNDDLVAFALQNKQRKICTDCVRRLAFGALWILNGMVWCVVNWNCMRSSSVWMGPVFLVAPTVIQWQNSYTHVLCWL